MFALTRRIGDRTKGEAVSYMTKIMSPLWEEMDIFETDEAAIIRDEADIPHHRFWDDPDTKDVLFFVIEDDGYECFLVSRKRGRLEVVERYLVATAYIQLGVLI